MTVNLFDRGGCPPERQRFTWKELAGKPISKFDDDAFTRVRIILMNGVELDSVRMKLAEALKQKNERLALVRGWPRAAVLQEAT